MMRRLGIAVTVVAVSVAGCSSGDDGGGGPGGLATGDGIADQLESLPLPASLDDSAYFTVAYGDLAEASSLAGVEVTGDPEDPADTEDLLKQLLSITTGAIESEDPSPVLALTPEAAHVERLIDLPEFVDEVGWNVFEVRRFVETQNPPNSVTVMEGDFDEDRLDEALGEAGDGVWVAGDPGGDLDIANASPARPIGEPLWLSLVDDRLVVARTAEDMEAVRSSDGPKVADDEVMTVLAESLDDAGVYSAQLFRGDMGFPGSSSAVSPAELEQRCEDGLSEPFVGVGTGIADDDGPVVVLTYVHPEASGAEATAEQLQTLLQEGASAVNGEPWSESLEIEDISADGNVTVARLRPVEPIRAAMWRQLVLERDNLVTYC